jgi:hypothetical protein
MYLLQDKIVYLPKANKKKNKKKYNSLPAKGKKTKQKNIIVYLPKAFSAYEYIFLVPRSYVQRRAQISMKLVLM